MASRRQFLKGSLATTGVALAGAAFAGPGIAFMPGFSGARLPLHGVVFEPRLARSTTFAAEARRLGLPTFGIEGDVTPVWARIVDLWRAEPVAIGGLTTHIPLMLLEQSGRDHGMRVAYRAEHRPRRDGMVAHALSGPPEIIGAFGLEARRRREYGACLARALVQCPAAPGVRDTTSLQTPAGDGAVAAPLYSWVLAPRHALPRGANA